MDCQICGGKSSDDLFSYVTQEPACSACVLSFPGLSSPIASPAIANVRKKLGLADGEFYRQDHAGVAAAILGRPKPAIRRQR